MNTFTIRRRRFILAAALTLGAPFSAMAADPGITADKILIGSYLPLQGGLAAGANQLRDGADAYFKFVNDAGGIHGRKVEWLVENDSYNPQQTIAVAKKLVDRDGVFAIVSTLGTATNLAALPYLIQRNVPVVSPSGGSPLLTDPKDPHVFGLTPTGQKNGVAMVNYAIDAFKAKRVAIFFQNDPFGKDPRDGAVETLEKNGMKTVAEASYIPSDVDVSAQAIALRDSDPDVVLICAITKQGALLLKEAEKLGWKPKFIAMNTLGDPITRELAGSALDGTVIALFTAVNTMPNPLVIQANDILKKYHPNTEPGYWAYLGYAGAMLFVEGAKIAGPDLTRDKLLKSIETLKNFQTGVLPPLTFSAERHGGADKFGFAVWRDGKLNVTQGW
jgi:ABC-type branched-subunit amino acid transport system substrate-binding protein